jgi:hypothetical protein
MHLQARLGHAIVSLTKAYSRDVTHTNGESSGTPILSDEVLLLVSSPELTPLGIGLRAAMAPSPAWETVLYGIEEPLESAGVSLTIKC